MIESEKSRLFSAFFQSLKMKKSPEYLGFRIMIESEKSRRRNQKEEHKEERQKKEM